MYDNIIALWHEISTNTVKMFFFFFFFSNFTPAIGDDNNSMEFMQENKNGIYFYF
jgi:hypothetical protein